MLRYLRLILKYQGKKKGGGVDGTKMQNADNPWSLVKGIHGYIILFSLLIVMVNFVSTWAGHVGAQIKPSLGVSEGVSGGD